MSNNYKEFPYRVCSFCDCRLVRSEFFKSKDDAIKYFNQLVTSGLENYFYEIWKYNDLLFSTEA